MDSKLVNIPIIFRPKQVEANLPMSRPVHVMINDQAWTGLPENKTKPTWTRIAQMDCGPKNTNCAATKPTLGKRIMQGEEAVAVLGTKGRERKRSKSQNDAQTNGTTGVLEHPGQTQCGY